MAASEASTGRDSAPLGEKERRAVMAIIKKSLQMPAVLVSVVIACRNESRFIARAVGALLNGSVPEIEVIVVDGVSTDGTRQVLAHLQQCDTRLVVLDNPARITPVAFNLV